MSLNQQTIPVKIQAVRVVVGDSPTALPDNRNCGQALRDDKAGEASGRARKACGNVVKIKARRGDPTVLASVSTAETIAFEGEPSLLRAGWVLTPIRKSTLLIST